MALGNRILLAADPGGRFEEGTIAGTPKPGVVVGKTSAAEVGGRPTFEPAGTTAANSTFSGMAADGNNVPVAILLSALDHAACPPWKDATTAYADGERCAVYYPIGGEEFNMIVQDTSGTGADQDLVANLTKLIIDDGTGKLVISSGSPEQECFISLETKADLAADYLCRVQYIG